MSLSAEEAMLAKYDRAIGKAISARRKTLGLRQDQLGDAVHRTYVSDIERGLKSPSYRTLLKVANALGCQASDLVLEAERRMSANSA